MKFARFLKTSFYSRTPPVAASGNENLIFSNAAGYNFYFRNYFIFIIDFCRNLKQALFNKIFLGTHTFVAECFSTFQFLKEKKKVTN